MQGERKESLLFRAAAGKPAKNWKFFAEIAQLVEHDLAKVGVASSSLVFRSKKNASLSVGVFLSNLIDFHGEGHAEAGSYVGHHGGGQGQDIVTRGAAPVD